MPKKVLNRYNDMMPLNDTRNIPDRSKSDFHCLTCQTRMDSQMMWDAHISGKRHAKNLKKAPGEMPSKVKFVPCTIRPRIADQLEDTNEIIVGLSYICETNHQDKSIDPFYNCYLCRGSFTLHSIMEHIISSKHRTNYLKREDPQHTLDNLHLSKRQLTSLLADRARIMEETNGRGTMEVKIEKINCPSSRQYISGSSHHGSNHPKVESHHTYIDPSLPSTSSVKPSTAVGPSSTAVGSSSAASIASSSKISSHKVASTQKHKRKRTAAELDWNLERDAKHLDNHQISIIMEAAVANVEANIEAYKHPSKLEELLEMRRIIRGLHYRELYASFTPAEREEFPKLVSAEATSQRVIKEVQRMDNCDLISLFHLKLPHNA